MKKPVKTIWKTPKAEAMIGYIARVSNPANQDNPNVAGLIRYMLNNGHWSPFEQAAWCIEVETSRAISAQIIRHHSMRFQEFSQRYAAVDNTGVIIYAARRQDTKNRQNSIDDIDPAIQKEWKKRQQENWQRAFEHYQWGLDNGIAKECARMVLPLQTSTRIYMTGWLRDWIFYILARTHPTAQKEHRDLANHIRTLFIKEFPVIAEALVWK